MPLPLEKITEKIFESLPKKEAVQFFANIPHAIDIDGKDLSLVLWQFLRDTLLRLPEITKETQTVIDGISLLAEGKEWSKDEALAAYEAASAVVTADSGAVYWAAYAAYCAAVAAASGAAAQQETRKQAQSIIQLLKDAPSGEANAD